MQNLPTNLVQRIDPVPISSSFIKEIEIKKVEDSSKICNSSSVRPGTIINDGKQHHIVLQHTPAKSPDTYTHGLITIPIDPKWDPEELNKIDFDEYKDKYSKTHVLDVRA